MCVSGTEINFVEENCIIFFIADKGRYFSKYWYKFAITNADLNKIVFLCFLLYFLFRHTFQFGAD